MSYNVEAVAGQLLGTDQDLSDVVGSHLTSNWSFRDELREHAMRCISCRHWFPPEQMDSGDEETAECEGCSE